MAPPSRSDRAVIPVVAVVGPTGAGKSALALDLAEQLGGEIVNADSMQLYRGMDIGTAKVPSGERRGIPHHLLDVWDVTHTADVAAYQRLARSVIEKLVSLGVAPVLVGGSGLYVRAALDALDFPGTDPALRARLEAELTEVGPHHLHARLARFDPAAAEGILPSNGRRIVRALEVVELTGGFHARLPEYRSVYDAVLLGVDGEDLDSLIEVRVRSMWRAGLVDEVHALVGRGLRESRTAARALGYAQVLDFLDGRLPTAEATQNAIAAATRRFARRQRRWFRRDPRVQWLAEPDRRAALAALRH
ncbi:MAG: tRNA (adenosine(37)-N6)-dimethylallyltransferase MiaA [Frankiaceae bacterium]